jgi:hypothetical protein
MKSREVEVAACRVGRFSAHALQSFAWANKNILPTLRKTSQVARMQYGRVTKDYFLRLGGNHEKYNIEKYNNGKQKNEKYI